MGSPVAPQNYLTLAAALLREDVLLEMSVEEEERARECERGTRDNVIVVNFRKPDRMQ